ncbi:MAG: hypothetical protein IMW97_08090 [Firmicutes bacterium]|nr:hypothetical protein [Candidatus Fermentithermobacillaceae bacterium]
MVKTFAECGLTRVPPVGSFAYNLDDRGRLALERPGAVLANGIDSIKP